MAITGMPTLTAINNLKIAQVANALYGYVVGATTNNAVLADIATMNDSFNATVNAYYTYSFGSSTAAAVAASMATNMGIVAGSHGLVAADVTAAVTYISAQITAAPGAEGAAVASILALWSGLTTDATYGTAATAWNATIADAQAYTASGATADYAVGSAFTYPLTTGIDNMTGTSGADAFQAYIMDNQNTLQDGDVLNGGAGADTLYADIGASQDFAITAQTSNIETVQIRAQSNDTEGAQNNPNGQGGAHIDAQRMSGVTQWESNSSRADVFIEDVRINSNVTTIAFVESDPGDVDLALYFNQRNLVNTTASTSSLNLQVMDTVAAAAGADPLRDSTYGAFTFTATDENGVATVVTLTSQAIQDAQTYAQMVTAFQDALDAQFGAGAATATVGDNFTVVDPASGTSCTGQSVVLTATGNITFTTPTGSGWSSSGVAPAASNFYTNWSTGGSGSTALVNTDIILDDVGLGSQGGALLVGGMSTGMTSNSLGVQRFNIEVRDNSKLTTINSTDNTLREVVIVNGTTSSSSTAYVTTTTDAGNLSVNGGGDVLEGANRGSTVVHAGGAAAGFTDVRLIDASAMTGQFSFTAAVTVDAIDKYVNSVDTAASPTADVATNNTVGLGANFDYQGGTNNDSMDITIDGSVAASRSTIVSGLSDFTFSISGGSGDDAITVDVVDSTNTALLGGLEDWYYNQNLNNNITINGGAGNDTITTPGAGDTTIDAGSGNDLVFTDNTGAQAAGALAVDVVDKGVWLMNVAGQTAAVADAAAFRDLDDLRSDANDSYNLYKATLQVSFKGLPSATITLANTSTYKTTDLEINQAIKDAINNDATLSNLLVARDGPGNSLVIESLIDGVMTTGDLTVTITAPTAELSTAELSAANTAWGTSYATSALALAAEGTVVTTFNTRADYVDVLATDGTTTERTGADSSAVSDNFVTPGTGNDIIVLGTTEGLSVATSSNEVVKYTAADFGDDVVVNFTVAGAGMDYLDFSTLGVKSTGAFSNLVTGAGLTSGLSAGTDGSIFIEDLVTTDGVATDNDSAANVKELFTDGTPAATRKAIYVAVSSNNVGTVYQVVDGTAATDITVTSLGSIDLADTAWSTFTAITSFVAPTVYADGPVAAAGAITAAVNGGGAQVLTGTAFADVLNGSAAQTAGDTLTINGLAGNDTITGGGFADVIDGGAGNDTINPGEGADTVTGGAGTDTITLTDVDNAADIVKITSALAADADTITGFTTAEDDLQFSVAGIGLNAADYAAGVVTVVNAAAAAALGAGAWNNHIVVDTAANIAALTIGAGSATGGVLAIASDTGAISYDADGAFAAGAVVIGTVSTAAAFVAGDLAIIA